MKTAISHVSIPEVRQCIENMFKYKVCFNKVGNLIYYTNNDYEN